MNLENISYCRYFTDLDVEWENRHFDVRAIVRAIKGETFNGYADLKIGRSWRRLTNSNPELATEWFVDAVFTQTKFTALTMLVPFPSSQCTRTTSSPSRTLLLAHALAARIPTLGIWDGLRFREPMQKKIRDQDVLSKSLISLTSVPVDANLMILDDVCTTGAHAKAGADVLRKLGASNVQAMSVARTTHDPSLPSFGFQMDSL